MKELYFNIENIQIPYTLLNTDDLVDSINNISHRKLYFLCDQNLTNVPAFKKMISKTTNVEAIYFIQATEKEKNLASIATISEFFIKKGIDRQSMLLIFGGGTVGNIGGMVASLLFRGIDFIHIPTTFLALSDSVFSLKQAVNTRLGKNQLGLFAIPKKIFVNFDFVENQYHAIMVDGLYELVKNILIISPEFYTELKQIITKNKFDKELLYRLVEICKYSKEKVMSADKFEKNKAIVLEYGHTFGHAIEILSKGKVSHGYAIGIGMKIAAELSYKLGYLSLENKIKHDDLINIVSDFKYSCSIRDIDDLIMIMKKDNKRGYINTDADKLALVLIDNIGSPLCTNEFPLFQVDIELIRETMLEILIDEEVKYEAKGK
ncbi:TPA: hypothetical protein TUV01_001859 [Streptococcus equi subsp. zooepidemicus]|nr:hypothetical protein [Streptococcus equi subsp. zooepidemicus]